MVTVFSIILLAIGLTINCFAVSIAQGVQGVRLRSALVMAVLFGVFQGGMPLITYFVGTLFADFFTRWSPWIALVLLTFIGGKMLVDAYIEHRRSSSSGNRSSSPCNRSTEQDCQPSADNNQSSAISPQPSAVGVGTMLLLSVATSIDAFSVGVLFVPVPQLLWQAIALIALTSTGFSLVGFALGKILGRHLPFDANILAGCILIAIGIKIFIDGLMN